MVTSLYALAMDIGGTQIKAGILNAAGDILAFQRVDTPANSNPETVLQHLLTLQSRLFTEAGITTDQIKGIGISIAAFITAEGYITATAHLSREWVGYNLKDRLIRELRLPYYFALDTPAPTLGEAYYGAGKGVADFVFVTVSTGIGAGIISGGKYLIGGKGWAGGVGHTIIDETSPRVCTGCGNHGCLETFAAKQGIIATALEVIRDNPASLLAQQYRAKPDDLSPRLIFEVAQKGDAAAANVFVQAGHMLGIGLTNLVDIISPTRLIIGGGISLAGDLLLDPIREVICQRAFPPQHREVEVVLAQLGDLSGMFGAAAMVFNDIKVNP